MTASSKGKFCSHNSILTCLLTDMKHLLMICLVAAYFSCFGLGSFKTNHITPRKRVRVRFNTTVVIDLCNSTSSRSVRQQTNANRHAKVKDKNKMAALSLASKDGHVDTNLKNQVEI